MLQNKTHALNELKILIDSAKKHLSDAASKQSKIFVGKESHTYFTSFSQKPSPSPQHQFSPKQAPITPKIPPPHIAASPKVQIKPQPQKHPSAAPKIPLQKEEATTTPNFTLTPESPSKTAPKDFTEIRDIIATHFPQIKLIENTKQPHELASTASIKPLALKSNAKTPGELEFLGKVASYLTSNGIPTTIINTNEQTPKLASQGAHILNIGDASRYLADPQLKIKLRDHLKTLYPQLP